MILSKYYKEIFSLISIETDKSRKRTLVFGFLGLLACLLVATVNVFRHLYVSATLVYILSTTIGIILFLDFKGVKHFIKASYVVSFNVFTTIIVFAEGLEPAGYLFFLVFLVALAFLLDNSGKSDPNVHIYLLFTAVCFSLCIIECPQQGMFQFIPEKLKHQMFVFNSITVIILISVFTYIGITLEKRIREALMIEKNKAQIQTAQINEQNKHLREIAFMSSHSIRMPVSNILGLTKMLETIHDNPQKEEQIKHYLRQSAEELDMVLHEIINKTASIDIKD